jgi:hypothetical protein
MLCLVLVLADPRPSHDYGGMRSGPTLALPEQCPRARRQTQIRLRATTPSYYVGL